MLSGLIYILTNYVYVNHKIRNFDEWKEMAANSALMPMERYQRVKIAEQLNHVLILVGGSKKKRFSAILCKA